MKERPDNVTDLSAVRAIVADAEPLPSVDNLFPHAVDSDGKRNGVGPGKWTPTALGIPDDCPVRPLGVTGKTGWFIDPIGQVETLAPPYGQGEILGLFGGLAGYLEWAWPRWGKKGIDGFAAERVRNDMMRACYALGPWRATDRVRGRGAWLGRDDKSLIVHTGTELLRDGRREPPSDIDGHVYPTAPPIPSPWPEPIPEHENPAKLLMPLIRSWQWARPEVDPWLFLGWIGAAMVAGALPWRPHIYIMGDKAVGKSTAQGLIKGLMGDWLIDAVDTTAAGLYQYIGTDSLAIAVDEFEPGKNTARAEAVLTLLRISSSGGMMRRGGDRHSPVQFRAQSCFVLSSINYPPMNPADRSRIAILALKRLQDGAAPPEMDSKTIAKIGRCILQRMVSQWPRYHETLQAFRAELSRGGMDSRSQDTFGALLACADLIAHDAWDEERVQCATSDGDLVPWSDLMNVDCMAEFEDMDDNWRKCLSHLLGVRVEAWRGGTRHTVGQVVHEFFKPHGSIKEDDAKVLLGQAGLALVKRRGATADIFPWWLAVPNNSPLVRQLFEGSDWAGAMGAGVWSGALRQSERGRIHEVAKARVNGDVLPCTLISLDGLYGEHGIMRLEKNNEHDPND